MSVIDVIAAFTGGLLLGCILTGCVWLVVNRNPPL